MFLLIIFLICLSFFSCSGKVGNDKTNSNTIDFNKPSIYYRLINNNTEYELISIEENYIGAFMVDSYYRDSNSYGYLPVTSIAEDAFNNHFAVFIIVIASNITHIGRNAFYGWRAYQSIYFEITEAQSKSDKYSFDRGWNANMEANIVWNAYAVIG